MEMTICNLQKGRLETIEVSMDTTNTTWFNDRQETDDIYTITDIDGDLLIKENNYNYPVLIYGISRADINHDPQKAKIKHPNITLEFKEQLIEEAKNRTR